MPKLTPAETKMINDIAIIMANREGPFTKTMLIEALSPLYPNLYYQELKNRISVAIAKDKDRRKPLFKSVRVNVWDLRERVDLTKGK